MALFFIVLIIAIGLFFTLVGFCALVSLEEPSALFIIISGLLFSSFSLFIPYKNEIREVSNPTYTFTESALVVEAKDKDNNTQRRIIEDVELYLRAKNGEKLNVYFQQDFGWINNNLGEMLIVKP